MVQQSNHLRLFLIRHGEVQGHSEHRLNGHRDVPLSDRGREQSEWLADLLSNSKLTAVYSSDLSRATYAAEMIAANHNLPMTQLAALREIDMGDWDGRAITEINESSPDLLASLYRNPGEFKYPNGESFSEFENRVIETLKNIRASNIQGEIAIVAHGGVCRMILGQVLELKPRNWLRLAQDYGCVNVIDWFDDFPIIQKINFNKSLV